MKKPIMFFFIVLALVSGCAPTLQEVRQDRPLKSLAIPKETFCVYSKINKAALEMPVSFWCRGFFNWHSYWDPALNTGEIFWGPDTPYPSILFQVYKKDNNTLIDAKTSHSSAACITDTLNLQRIEDILSSADFSTCSEGL